MRWLLAFSLIFLANCGSGSGGGEEIAELIEETPAAEAVEETTTAEPSEPNPIVSTQFFGESGNLYKPKADETASGAGNMVVLLSAQFTEQFDSCEVRKTDGTVAQLFCNNTVPWTQIPFSCFSNGNRQTWRANFPCGEVAEVLITCRSFNQEVVFTVPEAARGAVCSRFG